ncbi:MAG: flagellar brake protein [Gammaproteobacteria bacterium]|nr:flagellar brake protein [Gammaproteobacteria bacterium]
MAQSLYNATQKELDDSLITDQSYIPCLLARIKDSHANIEVHTKDHGSFNSLIIDVDHDNKTFIIDELVPKAVNALIKPGLNITVKGSSMGGALSLSSKIIECTTQDGLPCYIVETPKSIVYLQRREHYRARVNIRYNIRVNFIVNDKLLEGKLFDLSLGGFSATFDEDEVAALGIKSGDIIDTQWQIPEGPEMDHEAILQRFVTHPDKKGVKIGGKFLRLQKPMQMAVSRFITAIQREELKH